MAQKVGGGWDPESATAGTDVTVEMTLYDKPNQSVNSAAGSERPCSRTWRYE